MFFFLSFLFCKIRDKKGGTGPSQEGDLATVSGGGGRERGKESEYSAKNVYTCI
jgi:hypothetical protein